MIHSFWWNRPKGYNYSNERERRRWEYIMHSVVFTPDGLSIIAGDCEGNVFCWDFVTGALRWRKIGDAPQQGHGRYGVVDVSPDGKLVASSGADGHVRTWDVATGVLIADIDLGVIYNFTLTNVENIFDVHALAFSPDGTWIACGMGEHEHSIDPILGVDTHTWSVFRVGEFLNKRYSAVHRIIFSPDGRRLVTCAEDGIRVYLVSESSDKLGQKRLHGGERRLGYFFQDGVETEDFISTDNIALTNTGRGLFLLVEHDHGQETYIECINLITESPTFALHNDEGIGIVDVSRDGCWLTVGTEGDIIVLDLRK
ncbi:MAG: WD40 repeat domain-containing protein [Candidatus Sigynarchaeota archaeon]